MRATTSMPVILYGRVSRESSPDAKSVDDQLAELRRWAAREGWKVVDEFRDDGISASRYANGKARAGWEASINIIRSGKLRGGALLVWEFSRATRDKEVAARLEVECEQNGVMVGYHGTLRDPSTADGGFGLGLDALLAARESAVTSERVRRAAESRAAVGKPAGPLAYGYRRVIDPATGGTVGREADPEQAPVLREIVRRLLGRESARSIAADLNRRGIPTRRGKAWTGGNLAKIAMNPAYAGLRVHHGKVLPDVEAKWPALISEAEHYQLLAMHTDPDRDQYRNPTNVRHIGTGIFRCGREGCDGVMRVVHQSGGRPNAYNCRKCTRVSRHQAPVDLFVETLMWRRLSRPDVLDVLARAAGEDEELKAAAEEVVRLELRLADLKRRVADGELSLDDLGFFRSRWEPELANARERARPRALPPVVSEVAGADAERKWKALGVGEKRALVAAFLDVTILPVGFGVKVPMSESVRIEWRTG